MIVNRGPTTNVYIYFLLGECLYEKKFDFIKSLYKL